MRESSALPARLRAIAAECGSTQADPRPPDAWRTGGLARAQLHEFYAAEAEDAPAAAGFAAALALAGRALPILWLRTEGAEREQGRLHATGLAEIGLDAAALVVAVVADEAALLRAAADAARCAGLGTLVVEAWGTMAALDLTATRRLMLAAEASGVTVLILRAGAPAPSAAATRWGVAAAPSQPLAPDAPGHSTFVIDLLRRRGGPAGQRWCVEWNRETQCFDARAPLSGAGVPLATDRAAALDPPASVRRAG